MTLKKQQPDLVPHFELVFHETERDFQGRTFYGTRFEPSEKMSDDEKYMYNARLYIDIANKFEHSIIMVSPLNWPVIEHSEDICQIIKRIRDIESGQFCIMATGDPTFKIPSDPVSFSEQVYDNPRELKAVARQQVDRMIPLYENVMEAGADGVIMCSDYAFNSGPFLSPDQFAEFITPYLTEAIKAIHELGGLTIKHTDGNLMPIIDQIVGAGPDALHSIDPMAEMDIKIIKEIYGDQIALCGNVHCAYLQTGTPKQIRNSAEYCLKHAKKGGGYIFSTSNCVFRGMPLESYDLIHNIWKENRSY